MSGSRSVRTEDAGRARICIVSLASALSESLGHQLAQERCTIKTVWIRRDRFKEQRLPGGCGVGIADVRPVRESRELEARII